MTPVQLATGAGAVNLGYNIVGASVKDAVSWKTAQAVAIEVAKDRFQNWATPALEARQAAAARELAGQSRVLETARSRIETMNAKLAGKLGDARRARYARGLARESASAVQTQAKMASAGATRTAASAGVKAIPIVFLAWDVLNASSDLSEVYRHTQ